MNVGDRISNEEIIKYMQETLPKKEFERWVEKFLDRVFKKGKMTPMSYLKFLMGQEPYGAEPSMELVKKLSEENWRIKEIRQENKGLLKYLPHYDIQIDEVSEESDSQFSGYLASCFLNRYGASAVPSLKKLLPENSMVFDKDGFLVWSNYQGKVGFDVLGAISASMPKCDKASISTKNYAFRVLNSGDYRLVTVGGVESAGVAAASEVCVREDGYANLVKRYLGDDTEVVIETNGGTYKLEPIPGGGSDPTLPEGVKVITHYNDGSTEQNNKQDNYNKINLNALDDIKPC